MSEPKKVAARIEEAEAALMRDAAKRMRDDRDSRWRVVGTPQRACASHRGRRVRGPLDAIRGSGANPERRMETAWVCGRAEGGRVMAERLGPTCTICGERLNGLWHSCGGTPAHPRIPLVEQPPHFCPVCGHECGATRPRAAFVVSESWQRMDDPYDRETR